MTISSKHHALTQGWFHVGPALQTVVEHKTSIGSMRLVCWEGIHVVSTLVLKISSILFSLLISTVTCHNFLTRPNTSNRLIMLFYRRPPPLELEYTISGKISYCNTLHLRFCIINLRFYCKFYFIPVGLGPYTVNREMFAKIAYKQNINMWKINFSLQHIKLKLCTKLFFRPKKIFANNVLIYFFTYFGISEREVPGNWNLELKVPGIWELRNLGSSELGNLFKGIPVYCAGDISYLLRFAFKFFFYTFLEKPMLYPHNVCLLVRSYFWSRSFVSAIDFFKFCSGI